MTDEGEVKPRPDETGGTRTGDAATGDHHSADAHGDHSHDHGIELSAEELEKKKKVDDDVPEPLKGALQYALDGLYGVEADKDEFGELIIKDTQKGKEIKDTIVNKFKAAQLHGEPLKKEDAVAFLEAHNASPRTVAELTKDLPSRDEKAEAAADASAELPPDQQAHVKAKIEEKQKEVEQAEKDIQAAVDDPNNGLTGKERDEAKQALHGIASWKIMLDQLKESKAVHIGWLIVVWTVIAFAGSFLVTALAINKASGRARK